MLSSSNTHKKQSNQESLVAGLQALKPGTLFELNNILKGPDYQQMSLFGENDISFVMIERAKAGYSSNIERNQQVADLFCDQVLTCIWKYLYTIKNEKLSNPDEFVGIIDIIKQEDPEKEKLVQGAHPLCWGSDAREVSQRLCGWPSTREGLEKEIQMIQKDGLYSRAAALAVWQFDLPLALECLSHSSVTDPDNPTAQILMIALSGYNSKSDLWKKSILHLITEVQDPYVVGIFSFLCGEGDMSPTYFQVLAQDIALADKVAFACRFLPRPLLVKYLKQLRASSVKEGKLDGLLVTGLSSTGEATNIIQGYIDKTGDVQTAALLACQVPPNPFFTIWITCYRELLDSWKMWSQRAHFDVNRPKRESINPQVFLRCKYCSSAFISGNPNNTRIINEMQACPNCLKPLPRCTICLLPVQITDNPQDWFSWCQTCKHAGHSKHLEEWFQTHKECPANNCNCRCTSHKGWLQPDKEGAGEIQYAVYTDIAAHTREAYSPTPCDLEQMFRPHFTNLGRDDQLALILLAPGSKNLPILTQSSSQAHWNTAIAIADSSDRTKNQISKQRTNWCPDSDDPPIFTEHGICTTCGASCRQTKFLL